MAPFWRIQSSAAEVSRPPEKAMPTFWPAGSDWRMVWDMGWRRAVPRRSKVRVNREAGYCPTFPAAAAGRRAAKAAFKRS